MGGGHNGVEKLAYGILKLPYVICGLDKAVFLNYNAGFSKKRPAFSCKPFHRVKNGLVEPLYIGISKLRKLFDWCNPWIWRKDGNKLTN